MAAAPGRAPSRRSTQPEFQPVSGRRFHAVKSEDAGDGETFTPEQREAANREFDEDVERDRERYRREGAREARRSGRSSPGRPRSRPLTERPVPGVGLSVEDGAGFVLGLLAWVLTVQYLRGGTPAVKAWLRAKFLNRTSGARPR